MTPDLRLWLYILGLALLVIGSVGVLGLAYLAEVEADVDRERFQ
jgi:hypothetical protein